MGFNGFPTDTTSDSEKGTMEIVVRLEIGRRYSLYMAETMKIFLEDSIITDKLSVTDSTLYIGDVIKQDKDSY